MSSPTQLIDDLRLLEPPNPWMVYYWVGGVLAGLLFLYLLVRISRALKNRWATSSKRAIRAAQADALAALQELFAMVEQEMGKEYATQSSAIIRQYIERRFDIRAPVQSTEEFLTEAQHSPLLAGIHQDLLGDFLNCCDFLKFARGVASREELEELHTAAVLFIEETRAGSEPGSAGGIM